MDKEMIAKQLGFNSLEEFEKYYDLCRGNLKKEINPTKELCTKIIIDNEWETLLDAPRERRLETKLYFDFDGLLEATRMGNETLEKELKALISYELSELKNCYANKKDKSR